MHKLTHQNLISSKGEFWPFQTLKHIINVVLLLEIVYFGSDVNKLK